MVSMNVDLLTITVLGAATANVDVVATAVVVMAIDAPERASVDAVDVAATPVVQRPAAMEVRGRGKEVGLGGQVLVRGRGKEHLVW